MKTPLFIFTQTGFIILTILCYAIVLKELKSALPLTSFTQEKQKKILTRTFLFILLWMIATSALALSGILMDFSLPPKFGIILIIPLVGILFITFSKSLSEILRVIPLQNIIRLQSFRVLVEVLLWLCFIQNLIPVQMTFEGRNFDILSGISALGIVFLISRNSISKRAILIWNIAGMILLINIVTIAMLSLPTPFRVFMNEPANTIVAQFPFVWLPAFLVPLAYGLHFFSLRQLTIKNN